MHVCNDFQCSNNSLSHKCLFCFIYEVGGSKRSPSTNIHTTCHHPCPSRVLDQRPSRGRTLVVLSAPGRRYRVGKTMLGVPCWQAHVGSTMLGVPCWKAHVGSTMLGVPCWQAHVGSTMLGVPCWKAHVGSTILGVPCWKYQNTMSASPSWEYLQLWLCHAHFDVLVLEIMGVPCQVLEHQP